MNQKERLDPKEPFDIDEAVVRVRHAVKPFPKAAMFALVEEGYESAFEQLIACIISIRTRDETTLVCARRLFELAHTPAEMAALSVDQINKAIAEATFHESKSFNIQAIAQQIMAAYGGQMPCDESTLRSFKGVGVKCANLVLGLTCEQPRVGVDIHVHRVCNRWGYVSTKTPEDTTDVLTERLPKVYWVEINALLVPFGKHICTGKSPKCSVCPMLPMCAQVGVTSHR